MSALDDAAAIAVHIEGRSMADAMLGHDLCVLAGVSYWTQWTPARQVMRAADTDLYRWVSMVGYQYYDSRAQRRQERQNYAARCHTHYGLMSALRKRATSLMMRNPADSPANHWFLIALQYNALLRQLDADDGKQWWTGLPQEQRAKVVRDYILLRTLDDHLASGVVEAPDGLHRAPDSADAPTPIPTPS